MTEIYLCDNELIWLEQMEQAISDFIISSDWALAIACRASAPQELLNQLMQHRTSGGIYFLDINLRSEMNGITLGAEIRKLDPEAVLVFVTSHDELVMDTFRLKLQATDYILKDSGNLRAQIRETLRVVESRYGRFAGKLSAPRVRLETGGFVHFIIKNDIYFVESEKNQHKLSVHLRSEMFTLAMPLKELAALLGGDFIFCRRGCLVNPLHITALDQKAREIVFDNRERCHCSHRAWRIVTDKMDIKVF